MQRRPSRTRKAPSRYSEEKEAKKKKRQRKKAKKNLSVVDNPDGVDSLHRIATSSQTVTFESLVDENGNFRPHPTIRLSTGSPCEVPEGWHTEKMGKRAAVNDPIMDLVRLAGTVYMSFSYEPGNLKKVLKRMKAIKPNINVPMQRLAGHRVWQSTTGEPGNESIPWLPGFATVGTLQKMVFSGNLTPSRPWMIDVLATLHAYIKPGSSPWKSPLMRVLIPLPQENKEEQKSDNQGVAGTLFLSLHVYFSRLLFYLIADDALHSLVKHLVPSAPIVTPVIKLPQFPQTFTSSQSETAANTPHYAFTLTGLLKAHEHQGYREACQPAGITLHLKRYQRQSLAWMEDHEKLPHMGLNSLFWEERQWKDGGAFFYFPSAGELRLERPPAVRGGLLCEEMGLGKTLEIASLVVNDLKRLKGQKKGEGGEEGEEAAEEKKEQQRRNSKSEVISRDSGESMHIANDTEGGNEEEEDLVQLDAEKLLVSNATLVIAPLTLVHQWANEMKKCAPSSISVSIYPKDENDHICKGERNQKRLIRIARLARRADMIITTYRTLAEERRNKVLLRIRWRRIILDEMQEVRSSTTELARACAGLRGEFRWMVSGTPFYMSIDDLNGELNFLGVQPFCLSDRIDGFWERRVAAPWAEKDVRARDLLDVLLDGVMIRHSKSQAMLDGRSILDLPPFLFEALPISLNPKATLNDPSSPAHNFCYRYIEELAASSLRHAIDVRSAVAGESSIQRANQLLRMQREVCISPFLVNGGAGCTSQIHELHRIVRERIRWDASLSVLEEDGAVDHEVGELNTMDGASALIALISENRFEGKRRHMFDGSISTGTAVKTTNTNNARRFDAFAVFEKNMVRHSNNVALNHDTKRHRAAESLQERLSSVENKVNLHKSRVNLRHCRSWVFVSPLSIKKILSRDGELVTLSAQTDDERKGAEYPKESGRIFTAQNISLFSVLPLSQPSVDRQLTHEDEEALLTAMTDPKEIRKILSQIKGAEDEKDQKEERKRSLQRLLQDTLSMNGNAKKKKTEKNSQNERTVELKEAIKKVSDEIKNIKEEIKKRKSSLVKAQRKSLADVLKRRRLRMVMRMRRPLRLLPLLRWQKAVEIISSGRTWVRGLPYAFTRKFFLRAKLIRALQEAENSGDRKKIADMKKTIRKHKAILGWRPSTPVPGISSHDGYLHSLTRTMKSIKEDAGHSLVALSDLTPYYELLGKVIADRTKRAEGGQVNTFGERNLAQTGFQLLNDLIEGKTGQCSICMDQVKDPTFTRCVHLFCAKCILRCFKAAKFVDKERHRQLAENEARCPECRQVYTIESLIRVRVSGNYPLKKRKKTEKIIRKRKARNEEKSDQNPKGKREGFENVKKGMKSCAREKRSLKIKGGNGLCLDVIDGSKKNTKPEAMSISANNCKPSKREKGTFVASSMVEGGATEEERRQNYNDVHDSAYHGNKAFSEEDSEDGESIEERDDDQEDEVEREGGAERFHLENRRFAGHVPRFTPAVSHDELKRLGIRGRMLSRVARFPAFSRVFVTNMHHATGACPLGAKPSQKPVDMSSNATICFEELAVADETSSSSSKLERTERQLGQIARTDGKEIILKKVPSQIIQSPPWWSPKMCALIREVKRLKGEKTVVFSQHRAAVLHAARVLNHAGVKCVRIVKGDRAEILQQAVQIFNTDTKCSVLLLHSGPAASGLTLTVSRHVILLEPFSKAGEEAQALNRCHRIGQAGNVKCCVLYYMNTVEERMLWLRKQEKELWGDTDSFSLPSSGFLNRASRTGIHSNGNGDFDLGGGSAKQLHRLKALLGILDIDSGE